VQALPPTANSGPSLNTENSVINLYGSRISYYAGKLEGVVPSAVDLL